MEEKFCKYCGEKIPMDAVLCTHCGRQIEELKSNSADQPNIVINNSNNNVNTNANVNNSGKYMGKPINKWVSLILCLCFGCLGVHKFYEGKVGMGILYLCTFGLCGVGVVIDAIAILLKPNPYYV